MGGRNRTGDTWIFSPFRGCAGSTENLTFSSFLADFFIVAHWSDVPRDERDAWRTRCMNARNERIGRNDQHHPNPSELRDRRHRHCRVHDTLHIQSLLQQVPRQVTASITTLYTL